MKADETPAIQSVLEADVKLSELRREQEFVMKKFEKGDMSGSVLIFQNFFLEFFSRQNITQFDQLLSLSSGSVQVLAISDSINFFIKI